MKGSGQNLDQVLPKRDDEGAATKKLESRHGGTPAVNTQTQPSVRNIGNFSRAREAQDTKSSNKLKIECLLEKGKEMSQS